MASFSGGDDPAVVVGQHYRFQRVAGNRNTAGTKSYLASGLRITKVEDAYTLRWLYAHHRCSVIAVSDAAGDNGHH